ncbi:transposase [Lapidilactobacillus concavus DSM 17758]|jgi:transposase-like protein|uniref:Mutator family transposase n=2 Tax=Lactobacillaceae TaxID=33958 RepID=A0A0R1VZH4_9LACO|nr:IS256 family transposase [Lapidilactobacillus concavus]KRM09275.1 transposase [Lapidilactobacillus concavus DSM 17758]GEL14190.1 IS256 family transposase [Lapidilactobacillus concavus]
MDQFNKEIAQALLSQGNLKEVFRAQLERTVNSLLQAELTAILGYDPYDRSGFNSGNSRNGQYFRQIASEYGKLNICVPRDRNGEFKAALIPPYTRRVDALEEMVIKLYEKGITTREIADLIEKMYGSHYCATTISNMTNVVEGQVETFHERHFTEANFVCLFIDATYLPLRRNTVEREAVYIAIGITANGEKQILDYQIAPTENGEVWSELLGGLVKRGIINVQLIVADGMVGLESALERSYPQAKFQRCLVHMSRNIFKKVRVSDRQAVMSEFKQIHQATTKSEAQKVLDTFITHWEPSYSKMTKRLAETQNLLTFFDFPTSIRASIYSTNLIESFNKSIKRKTKAKEQFPNEDALDRFLVTQVLAYNEKNFGKSHRGFKQCQDTLESMF